MLIYVCLFVFRPGHAMVRACQIWIRGKLRKRAALFLISVIELPSGASMDAFSDSTRKHLLLHRCLGDLTHTNIEIFRCILHLRICVSCEPRSVVPMQHGDKTKIQVDCHQWQDGKTTHVSNCCSAFCKP